MQRPDAVMALAKSPPKPRGDAALLRGAGPGLARPQLRLSWLIGFLGGFHIGGALGALGLDGVRELNGFRVFRAARRFISRDPDLARVQIIDQ